MKGFIFLIVFFLITITSGLSAEECHYRLSGDVNGDCRVDFQDIAEVCPCWLIDCDQDPSNPACVPLDIDGDGFNVLADCNDNDPNINPGAFDFPRDGIDQDCDGSDSDYYSIDQMCYGDLVITEIMNNPVGVSDTEGEWFEIYNAAAVDFDLKGLTAADAGSNYFLVDDHIAVRSGEYFVFGRTPDAGICRVTADYVYSSMTLTNTADQIILTVPAGIIDSVYYDPNFPVVQGGSMMLLSSFTDANSNDFPHNWIETAQEPEYELPCGDYATPGRAN